jgi:hypothetical protein
VHNLNNFFILFKIFGRSPAVRFASAWVGSSALRWRSPSSVTHCVRSLRWAATQVLHCLPKGLQKVRIPTNPPRAPGFVGKFPFSQSLKSHIFRQKHNNPIILSEKIHKIHLKTKKALHFFPTKHPQNLRLVGKKSQPPPQNPNFFRQIPATHSVLSEKTHLPRQKKRTTPASPPASFT